MSTVTESNTSEARRLRDLADLFDLEGDTAMRNLLLLEAEYAESAAALSHLTATPTAPR